MHSDKISFHQPTGTALALILACERLISEQGSGSASMRKITELAGASNASAINYHFGSREGLFIAVLQYRMGGINQLRLQYIEKLTEENRLLDQRSLVSAMIHPLSEQLVAREEGNHYVRFLERMMREGPRTALPAMEPLTIGMVKLDALLRRTMIWLPAPIVDFRANLVTEQAVTGLASIEMQLECGALTRTELPLHIEMLIDALTTMLAGPISSNSLQLLSTVGLSSI